MAPAIILAALQGALAERDGLPGAKRQRARGRYSLAGGARGASTGPLALAHAPADRWRTVRLTGLGMREAQGDVNLVLRGLVMRVAGGQGRAAQALVRGRGQ